jgi:transcriptional regulator with XRE-family HTH domain
MVSEQFGALIRTARLGQGRTQAALAREARVARAVLSRLEQGRPMAVQSDTLDRLLAALAIEPHVSAAAGRDDARRLARLEQELRLREQRERHLRLAHELRQASPAAAKRKIERARRRVALWRAQGTCSPYYIERWSRLLALPPRRLARAMLSLGDWQDALFQNTPWSWAWS